MVHAVSDAFQPVDQPFWAGLREDRLSIQRCPSCRTWSWPPQWRCGTCGDWDMAWENVPMRGVVHAVTHTHHPFSPETIGHTPYANLLVELPDAGGARLLGLLDGEDGPVKAGDRVDGVVDHSPHPSGLPVLRWRLSGGHGA